MRILKILRPLLLVSCVFSFSSSASFASDFELDMEAEKIRQEMGKFIQTDLETRIDKPSIETRGSNTSKGVEVTVEKHEGAHDRPAVARL